MTNTAAQSQAFWHTPISTTIVRQLYALAGTPFTLAAFIPQWQAFGWIYTPASTDAFGFRIPITDQLRLLVQPSGERIGCAALPFCYWERFDRADHVTIESYRTARHHYDMLYAQAVQTTAIVLGQPQYSGHDSDADAAHYAVWQSAYALLILQQCAFDVQFGNEINFWLEPYQAETFTPTSPFIDWLVQRHRTPC